MYRRGDTSFLGGWRNLAVVAALALLTAAAVFNSRTQRIINDPEARAKARYYAQAVKTFLDPNSLQRHGHWMYEAEIVTAMGFIALGDQRPKMESHEGHRQTIGAGTQRTWWIARNIREGDVIVILRWTLDAFMDRITSIRPAPPRFVLVAVNSDDPVEARDRQRVAEFAPIVAFYATNLKRGAADDKCFPIPLGMPWHQWRYPNEPWANGSIGQPLKIDSTALNEDDRVGNLAEQRHIFDLRQKLVDGRIKKKAKVFWCGTFTSEVRKVYVEALQKADLLELCTGHISLGQWHDVLAQYAFVLSPRGIGYDCFRHWQVLSAGSIPIIPIEEDFDLRVFNGTTAWLVRSPEEVVEGFRARLPAAMKPPLTADLPDTLSLKAWNRRFRSHIKT